jgi:tetratricopeptide (TPR) repeat protein
MRRSGVVLSLVAAAFLTTSLATAQTSITLPPSGDNQKASVTQHIGPVTVSIDYSSPKVHSPLNGEDRRGKIWGKLVPYGLVNLGFGTCKECPWRGGANENTVFRVSNDVKIEGQPLPAGTYGFHLIADPEQWTIIFSKNSTSWGSFFYDPAEDQLRVKVKPSKSEYHEYLTYEFQDRTPTHATALLRWEDLQVPFTITVDDVPQVYLGIIRKELKGFKGFSWVNLNAAARYALRNKTDLPEALQWAQLAATPGFPGPENFTTLISLADLQDANGKEADAKATREKALSHSTATATDLHAYARQLQQEGKKDQAIAIWQLNAKRHPNVWPVNVGMMRAEASLGHKKEALKYAKLAAAEAPDPGNKQNLERLVKLLEEGKDID